MEKTSYSYVHVLAAHRILRDNIPKIYMSGSRKSEIVNVYLPMIDGLIVQACTFADDFPPPTAGIPPFYKLHFGLEKVHSISNWKDALDAIISLLRCVLRVTSDPVFYTVGKAEVAGALDRFAVKLVELQVTGSPPSDGMTEEEEYSHLRLHHRVATIMLHTLAEEDATVHDRYIPDFLLVLERCEHIIDRRASVPEEDLPNIRGPTLGILPPLFFVATKCRNHTIRHRALKLLHGTLLNEREWTSCMATMMAKFVVVQEEKLNGIMPGDEPDLVKVRLRLHDIDFSSSKHTMHLGYFLHVDGKPREYCCVTLPYMSHPSVQNNGVNTLMSRKTLRACGYSSIILFAPPIDCHCVDHDEPGLCRIEEIA